MLPDKFEKNISLANFTTWRIGGPAKFFFRAKNEQEILEVIDWVNNHAVKYFILGGGSNILANDNGFDGLIIKMHNDNLEITDDGECKIIKAGAGTQLAKIFIIAKQEGLTGLEWAFGIPGTIGGAVYGNAGAYGKNIGLSVIGVDVLKHGKIINVFNEDCEFSYRHSFFKELGNKEIILNVKLRFKKGDKIEVEKNIKEIMQSRQGRHPHEPSAGSVFKNIELKKYPAEFQQKIPVEKIKNGFVATAFLIEQCGLKGRQVGQVKISEIHANYFINLGGAKASDVKELIKTAKAEVQKKFGIGIEEEIVYLE